MPHPSPQLRAGWRGGQRACFRYGLSWAGRQGGQDRSRGNLRARPVGIAPHCTFLVIQRTSFGLLCFCSGGVGAGCKEIVTMKGGSERMVSQCWAHSRALVLWRGCDRSWGLLPSIRRPVGPGGLSPTALLEPHMPCQGQHPPPTRPWGPGMEGPLPASTPSWVF